MAASQQTTGNSLSLHSTTIHHPSSRPSQPTSFFTMDPTNTLPRPQPCLVPSLPCPPRRALDDSWSVPDLDLTERVAPCPRHVRGPPTRHERVKLQSVGLFRFRAALLLPTLRSPSLNQSMRAVFESAQVVVTDSPAAHASTVQYSTVLYRMDGVCVGRRVSTASHMSRAGLTEAGGTDRDQNRQRAPTDGLVTG